MTETARPSPLRLRQEAGGDGDRARNLPCGWPRKRAVAGLLEHLDEFCLYCLAGDCGSCEGGLCKCGHEGRLTP